LSGFLQGEITEANKPVKRFGYLISSVFLLLTVIAMLVHSVAVVWLFLITMYLLTGSLWAPPLIRPLYRIFGKYLVPSETRKPEEKTHDSPKKRR
jgi:hypothetical protein